MKLIAQEDMVAGRESNAIVAHDRAELEVTELGRAIRGWEAREPRLVLAF